MTIRVLIADDQDLVRQGFRMILDASEGIEVVADVDNGRDGVDMALHLRPDVCLFDIRMPELDGIAATELVAGPDVADPLRVVIVTTFDIDEYVYEALRVGATGFLLKNAGPELLLEAVRAASVGDSLISPSITKRLLSKVNHDGAKRAVPAGVGLTDREREVLQLVAKGLTNDEIRRTLQVSLSTAKAHVANLMTKVGARNRVEVVIWAYDHDQVGGD